MKGVVLIMVLFALTLMQSPDDAWAQGDPGRLPDTELETDLLPTLKSYMARLGSLMDLLFRDIGESEKLPELVEATDEMDRLLFAARKFKPEMALIELDPEKEEEVIQGFRACLERARAALADLRGVLTGGTGNEQKQQLLNLDQIRRECHGAFA